MTTETLAYVLLWTIIIIAFLVKNVWDKSWKAGFSWGIAVGLIFVNTLVSMNNIQEKYSTNDGITKDELEAVAKFGENLFLDSLTLVWKGLKSIIMSLIS